MGNCHSKTRDEDFEGSRRISDIQKCYKIATTAPLGPPPAYSVQHNDSCSILRLWEQEGEKSRGYQYVVYVIHNNLLNHEQKEGQDLILNTIQQYAAFHALTVRVKCLDYLSVQGSDADAERAKQLFKDMLAAGSRVELIQKWDTRHPEIYPLQNLTFQESSPRPANKKLKSSEAEIHEVIERLRKDQGLDDADAKSQIQPLLVAALSKFNRVWTTLEKFLQEKDEIFKAPPDVEADGISKLQAQFILQARAAVNSFDATHGSVPTVAIHILPDSIPNSTFVNIQRYMAAARVPLSTLVDTAGRSPGKPVRQDRCTMQLLSLGTKSGCCGSQWQTVDDAESGGMDTSDSTPINVTLLKARGGGPSLATKIMLGSVDADIDRQAKHDRFKAGLYGRGPFLSTKEETDRCECNKSTAD